MRKIVSVLAFILALCLCAPALAAVCFETESKVVPALRGQNTYVVVCRTRASEAGTLQVVTAQGEVLGQKKVSSGEDYTTVTIAVPEDAPAMQALRLLFIRDGESEEQGEFYLAADSRDHDGVRQGPADEKKIAITFDAAYGPGRLSDLLDVLDKYNAKCTFFLQGDFVTAFSDLTLEIDRRGHEVANHTMHHPDDIRQVSNDYAYWEIDQCNKAIESVTGKPVTLYRPPSGYCSYRDRAIARGLGCEVILWTFDSMDGFLETSTRETVWNALTKKSEPGAIILMHIYGYWTPEILDEYLPMMQEEGYEFVTVSELIYGSEEE